MITLQEELSYIASDIASALVLAELSGQTGIIRPLESAQKTLKKLIGPGDKKSSLNPCSNITMGQVETMLCIRSPVNRPNLY